MIYFAMPLKWNAITTYFSKNHLAIDLGWNNDHGGPNVAVYSCSSGTVVYAASTGSTAGIMVKVRLDDEKNNVTWYFQYKHLSKISVKKGDKVTIGKQIGNMGGTGGYAPHLHLDVVRCPYKYEYNQEVGNERAKYSVNPLDYCFLYPDQTTNEKSKNAITRLYGTNFKVAKNEAKDQIQVVGYKLRARKKPGLTEEILGYIDYGYYNILASSKKDNYTWYQIQQNIWIAATKEDTKVYLKKASNCEENLAKKEIEIKELEKEKKLLEEKVNRLEEENKKLAENGFEKDKFTLFTAPKSDYYYIYLEKSEEIYYMRHESTRIDTKKK